VVTTETSRVRATTGAKRDHERGPPPKPNQHVPPARRGEDSANCGASPASRAAGEVDPRGDACDTSRRGRRRRRPRSARPRRNESLANRSVWLAGFPNRSAMRSSSAGDSTVTMRGFVPRWGRRRRTLRAGASGAPHAGWPIEKRACSAAVDPTAGSPFPTRASSKNRAASYHRSSTFRRRRRARHRRGGDDLHCPRCGRVSPGASKIDQPSISGPLPGALRADGLGRVDRR